MENRLVLMLVLGLGTKGFAQTYSDNIGYQYSLYPSGKEYTTISKSKLYTNFNNRLFHLNLAHTLRLEVDQLELPIEYSINGSSTLNVYDFSYAVDLSYGVSDFMELHLEVEPTLTSNLGKAISSEDLYLFGEAFALLTGELNSRPYHLQLGIAYSRYLGEPELLPVVTFSTRISEKLSVKLGFPESKITYSLMPSGTLSAGLQYEGKYVNLSSPLYLEENGSTEKLKWEWTSLTMDYSYVLNELWSFEFGAGYLLKNNFSLRNENEETLSTFKLEPSPFLSSGIKLMFN